MVATGISERYAGHLPDPSVRALDERFEKYRLGVTAVERVVSGARWTEGPVWFGDHRCLLFSDIPEDRILRWDELSGTVSTFRRPANNANGNTRDTAGRLVTCEHRGRRVTRTDLDGAVQVVADSYEGVRLNAPNDVVVATDGAVWFTDPGFGIMNDFEGRRADPLLPTAVYRVGAGSTDAERVIQDLERPNGLCFSPDETRLYVVDSATPDIAVYDIGPDGRSAGGRRFATVEPGHSDGIRCDADGNVWAAVGWGGPGVDGVAVFAPDGTAIGRVDLPETCANLAFGGRYGNRLFMTASSSVYALYVNTGPPRFRGP